MAAVNDSAANTRPPPAGQAHASRAVTTLQRANELFKANKYLPALLRFREACLKCACNEKLMATVREFNVPLLDVPFPVCQCKDFKKAAVDADKRAMYKLAHKSCACGSEIAHCSSPAHIAALDGCAAAYEQFLEYDKAYNHAVLLVITAPEAPEGYLRMAKILRLQDAPGGVVPGTREICDGIYSKACESVRIFGNKHHPKLQTLARLFRKDPMETLPAEMQETVLGYLSLAELCRCMRVSKAWNRATRQPSLWEHLRFEPRWKPSQRKLPLNTLREILCNRARGLVKSVVISPLSHFSIDMERLLYILKESPKLEFLSVGQLGLPTPRTTDARLTRLSLDQVLNALFEEAPASLSRLRLHGFGEQPSWNTNSVTFASAARLVGSLKELSLVDVSITDQFVQNVLLASMWPALEKLYLAGTPREFWQSGLDLGELARVTPQLKELSLENYKVRLSFRVRQRSWKKLEKLVFGRGVRAYRPSSPSLPSGSTEEDTIIMDPWLPPSLRLLDIEECDAANTFIPPLPPHLNAPPLEPLENLEYFRLGHDIRGPCLPFLAASSVARRLRALDIGLCSGADYDPFPELDRHLPHKEDLEMVGCTGFRWAGGAAGGHSGDPFLDWVATLPNVTTVAAYPQHWNGCWMVIARLLQLKEKKTEEGEAAAAAGGGGGGSKIRTIYTDCLAGVFRDEIMARAEALGVSVVHAPRAPLPLLGPRETTP